jgi:tripartite-type tricarboxylate transporter receptor subunit TctC
MRYHPENIPGGARAMDRLPVIVRLVAVAAVRAGIAAWGCAFLLTAAAGADWPTKPVRIIVPFAAGGAADTPARMYGEVLSAAYGKQFVVENRTGGGGIPAAETVARAEPDGHTLLVSGVPIIVLGPAMNKNVGYDPLRDLTHIAYFGGTPNVLVAHPSLGIKTYGDFLAYARRAAGGTDYVSAGFGIMGNWVAEYLAAVENIKLNHIAYKGGSQATLDLLAGHVKLAMLTYTAVAEHIRAGRLDALAVTSANRLPYLPDLPTMRELGHDDFVSLTWFSLSGPAGMQKPVVDSLNREVARAMETPQIKKYIAQEAIEVRPMSPDDLVRFAQGEVARWDPLVKRIMAAQTR